MAGWNDFYESIVGASAALTGLIFVGVSISLTKILSIRGLPDRALLSLVLLLNVLVLSILFLIPDLSMKTLGIWVIVIGIIVWIIVSLLDLGIYRSKQKEYKKLHLLNMLIDQVATICFVLTGIGITSGWTNSEYWVVPAIIVSIVKAVIDGWVILVEINR